MLGLKQEKTTGRTVGTMDGRSDQSHGQETVPELRAYEIRRIERVSLINSLVFDRRELYTAPDLCSVWYS